MKYPIITFISLFLFGCKAQQLSFEEASLQEGVSGIEGGTSSYTFIMTTDVKTKSIGKFTKLWFNSICYTVSKQNIVREGKVTTIELQTQDPPRGFRSSKSPIQLTDDIQLVVEHSFKEKVEHLPIKKVNVKESISYPSAPPGE